MHSFDKYTDLYMQFKAEELKPSTFDKYEGIVEKRIKPVFFGRNIEDIKVSDVKLWLLNIKDVGNKSKKHYLSLLKGIFQEAFYDEVIDKNPVERVKNPKYTTPDIEPFTEDEVKKMLVYSKNFNFSKYLYIAFLTGMRSGEIIALKKSDIDLERNVIKVQRTRSRHGEGSPKTKSGIREIPIIDSLRPHIIELLDKHDNEYLFINQYGRAYRDTHVFVEKYWRPMLEDLKLEYRKLYYTRHTYASNMLEKNLITPKKLSDLLGHRDTEMVYRVYAKYIRDNLENFDRQISIYNGS